MKFKSITTLTTICAGLLWLMLPLTASAQPWAKQLKDKKNPTFYETQQAFNDYWAAKAPKGKNKIPKAKGYKQFKRWEWFWEPRVGQEGVFPDPSVNVQEWERYLATHPEATQGADQAATPPPPSISGGWTSLGPSTTTGGYAGIGRLNCIAFHPTDINTFWVGSPAGGMWKTTTGGTSWTTVTDNLPVLGVSAIAIHPTNPSIMYIATGDRDGGDTYSVGVLKSTNGGATWSATGLSYSVSQQVRVKGLLIHPTNPLILLAATSNGIYRTTNGGTNWTQEQTGDFQEIIFKPGTPATVYASTTGWGTAQIYRSTNTGDTWSQSTSFYGFNRIALAVTPANSSVVGALCSDDYNSGFGGYYTSYDSGAAFNLTYSNWGANLLGWAVDGSDSGGQGWYDLCLAISPTNASVVHVGGVNTWKSTNGGYNWSINTMWYGGTGVPTVHADKHYMAYHPLSSSTLFQCNDGGLYKTTDGGANWTDLSNGLRITQFYRMGNSATNSGLTIAGAQDNGTKIRNGSTYTDVIGGDGMEAIIDYSNANVMYGSLYFGNIYKTTDGGANFFPITESLPDGAWVSPYVMDPVNPQVLYAGVGKGVYKTTNGGSSWSAISGELVDYYNEIQNLAVAPSNTQTIYTGSHYSMFKTTNGGTSWTSVTLPSSGALTSIEVHPTNPQTLWISFSGYNSGQKVYRSTDGGATWTNISGTLPNLPANTLEYDKLTGHLYLGNDVGVFVRPSGATDWLVFDNGLPNVVVTELEIYYASLHVSSRLRASTYGRGLWQSDLYNVTNPFCTPFYTTGCTDDDYINNFSFNTLINNNSGCSNGTGTGYTNYAPAGTLTTSVQRGSGYSLKVQSGISYAQGFGVWIDYNKDSDFADAGEFVYASPSASTGLFSTTVTIPSTATTGTTRLRVRCRYNGTVAGTESCAEFAYGEAEEYTITITAPPSPFQWDKRFGGSGADNVSAAIQTTDGGYLLSGYSVSGISGDKLQASQGLNDYWIVKTGNTGNKLWDKRFGGSGDDFLSTVVQTSDGGYLLGGTSLSGISGDRTQATHGARDYWVVKVSSTGTKQWDRRFGGTADDELRAIVKLSTGEFLLAGLSSSGIGGDKTESSQGGQDYWIVKISSTGTKLWDKRFGGSLNDYLDAAISTSDGGFLLGGYSASGISGNKTEVSRGSNDYWIVKVSSTGTKQWDKRFGGAGSETLTGLSRTTDGHYMLVGSSGSGLGGDKSQASQGGTDFWMVKVSNTGAKLWDKRFGGSLTDEARTLVATADGGYLLGGRSDSGLGGDKSQSSQGTYDYWIVKTSSAGTKQWDKRFGGSASDQLRSAVQTSDGGYMLSGRSDSGISGDRTQPSQGSTDYWMVKVGSAGTAAPIAEPTTARVSADGADGSPESESSSLTASPNPFSDRVQLQFTLTQMGPVSLKVYSDQGQEVANLYEGEGEAGKQYTYEWRPGSSKAGVYIVRLAISGKTVSRKIVRIQ